MTSIALSSKWYPGSFSVTSPSFASLRIDQVIDRSAKGYERQPPPPRLRVPPTS
jgi:hypothetical protein